VKLSIHFHSHSGQEKNEHGKCRFKSAVCFPTLHFTPSPPLAINNKQGRQKNNLITRDKSMDGERNAGTVYAEGREGENLRVYSLCQSFLSTEIKKAWTCLHSSIHLRGVVFI
jgi:hypothetical protein